MTTLTLDEWFAAEILCLEAGLTRYLRRVWPREQDVPDLLQDIYVRVYESAARTRPDVPRAFVFATARNLIADRIRHERIVSIDYTQDFDVLNVLIDEISPEQRLNARQELRRLSDALDRLPDDCRNVIWLRRIEGLSQREVAERLGMREGTLESHVCRGVRQLIKAVLGDGTRVEALDRARGGRNESEHG